MLCLQTIKMLLQLANFIHVSLHQRALIILVDLFDDELRITFDDELPDSEVRRDPKTSKQPLVLCSVAR